MLTEPGECGIRYVLTFGHKQQLLFPFNYAFHTQDRGLCHLSSLLQQHSSDTVYLQGTTL